MPAELMPRYDAVNDTEIEWDLVLRDPTSKNSILRNGIPANPLKTYRDYSLKLVLEQASLDQEKRTIFLSYPEMVIASAFMLATVYTSKWDRRQWVLVSSWEKGSFWRHQTSTTWANITVATRTIAMTDLMRRKITIVVGQLPELEGEDE